MVRSSNRVERSKEKGSCAMEKGQFWHTRMGGRKEGRQEGGGELKIQKENGGGNRLEG